MRARTILRGMADVGLLLGLILLFVSVVGGALWGIAAATGGAERDEGDGAG